MLQKTTKNNKDLYLQVFSHEWILLTYFLDIGHTNFNKIPSTKLSLKLQSHNSKNNLTKISQHINCFTFILEHPSLVLTDSIVFFVRVKPPLNTNPLFLTIPPNYCTTLFLDHMYIATTFILLLIISLFLITHGSYFTAPTSMVFYFYS